MFERFTDRARKVVALAQEEARLLNHDFIGTEHILLGLVREGEGIGGRALAALDVSLEAVRQQVEETIGRGRKSPSGHVPFTPRSKKVLELSLREALQLGDNFIGTEHILLGLLREGEGVAVQVLVRLGVDQKRVRQQVLGLRGRDEPSGRLRRSRFASRAATPELRSAAEQRIIAALTSISERLTAIERKLGIENPAAPDPSAGQEPDAGAAEDAD